MSLKITMAMVHQRMNLKNIENSLRIVNICDNDNKNEFPLQYSRHTNGRRGNGDNSTIISGCFVEDIEYWYTKMTFYST